jgi:hypothetical protein
MESKMLKRKSLVFPMLGALSAMGALSGCDMLGGVEETAASSEVTASSQLAASSEGGSDLEVSSSSLNPPGGEDRPLLLWEGGMGPQLNTGGYWYGQADSYGSTWACDGFVADGSMQYVDAAPCDNGYSFFTHMDINAGTLQDDDWGWARVGFNFLDDGGSVQAPAFAEAAEYEGICVNYRADAPFRLQLASTNDVDDDLVGVHLYPNTQNVFIPWTRFRHEGWGLSTEPLEPATIYAAYFMLREADQNNEAGHNLMIRNISLSNGRCDETPVVEMPSYEEPLSSSSQSVPQTGGDLIWEGGMGAQVMTGGYWYGFADPYGSTWECAGTAYDGNETGVDASPCDNGSGFQATLAVRAGTPQDDDWGYAGVGFNFLDDGGAAVPPAYTDTRPWEGLCLNYRTSNPIRMELVTTDINDGDYFGVTLSEDETNAFVAWSSIRQEGWGAYVDNFDPGFINQIRFVQKESLQASEDGNTFILQNISLASQGGCYATEVPPISSYEPYSSSSQEINYSSYMPPAQDDALIWQGGMGAQVMTGGYWYGFADPYGSTWECAGTAYDGDEAGVDASPCDNGNGFEAHLTINAGTLQDDEWGFAAVGFNFMDDGGAHVPPAYLDAAAYEGLCVEYESDTFIRVITKTVLDEGYDWYGKTIFPYDTRIFIPWSSLRQEGWGMETYDFNPMALNQVHFMLQESRQTSTSGHDLLIKRISLSADGTRCGTISGLYPW